MPAWVIGSVVPVDTQGSSALADADPARGRHGIIALCHIVNFTECHDCNYDPAAHAPRNFEIPPNNSGEFVFSFFSFIFSLSLFFLILFFAVSTFMIPL